MMSQRPKLSLSSKLSKQQKISTFFGGKDDPSITSTSTGVTSNVTSNVAANVTSNVTANVASSDDEDEIAFMGCRPITPKSSRSLTSVFR